MQYFELVFALGPAGWECSIRTSARRPKHAHQGLLPVDAYVIPTTDVGYGDPLTDLLGLVYQDFAIRRESRRLGRLGGSPRGYSTPYLPLDE